MSLKRTLFYDHHLTAGGKMVDFGGWELPIQYSKMREEHLNVRTKAGLFDVSHMGEVFLEGEGALEAARFLVTNDLSIGEGQAQYTCICNSEGGIVDDVIVRALTYIPPPLTVTSTNQLLFKTNQLYGYLHG